MSSMLGSSLVLIGLAAAVFGAIAGVYGGMARWPTALTLARRSTWVFGAAMVLANLVMALALLAHDFSVTYVAQVGSRATPWVYSLVSLWSALEGSILFWGGVLGAYLAIFAWRSGDAPERQRTVALGTMLAIGAFFALLLSGPANPFVPTPPPVPLDGPGPNPLLQNHILMVAHPPMLYLGYVGLTLPFGIATAALLVQDPSDWWVRALRRFTLIPWVFLSAGILLGAWWAYAVLGWGGYWAWDPVENASLLPWLTTTAFVHTTLVIERRKMLRPWALGLALASFWLTMLGTFMTRSGVFNSVHSFTQSDIGPTFLGFLAVVLFLGIVLMAVRAPKLGLADRPKTIVSREGALLVNNLVLLAIAFTVLLGTVFPLVVEAIQDRRISVGEPYFNQLAVPFALLLLVLMGVGPSLPWGEADSKKMLARLLLPTAVAATVLLGVIFAGYDGFYPRATFAVAAFVTVVTLREMFGPAWARHTERKESVGRALWETISRGRRRFGGHIVHLGVVLIAVGVAASSSYKSTGLGTLKQGETLTVGRYGLTFNKLLEGREPHRSFVAAELMVTTPDGRTDLLAPRMNFYPRSNDPIGTPAVRTVASEDLYVSLITFNPQEQTASLRVFVFPLVSWLWLSLPFFVLGTLIAVWPMRKAATVALNAALPPVTVDGAKGEAA